MSAVITTIGSFVIGFLLACYFVGDGDNEFYEFCIKINKWVNKKQKKKDEAKKE